MSSFMLLKFVILFMYTLAALGLCCSIFFFLSQSMDSDSQAQYYGLGVAPAVCSILALRPGTEFLSPALKGSFLTTGSPWKSPITSFKNCYVPGLVL